MTLGSFFGLNSSRKRRDISPNVSPPPDDASTRENGSTTPTLDPGVASPDSADSTRMTPDNVSLKAPTSHHLAKAAASVATFGLNALKESSDAFPPLKSVAGGLSFILTNYEVNTQFYRFMHVVDLLKKWVSNKKDTRRLLERVEALHAKFQKGGMADHDGDEKQRRAELEEYVATPLCFRRLA